MARQEYASDFAGVTPARAKVQMIEWNKHPIEVAGCLTCGHPYLLHFDARQLDGKDAPAVGCHGCGNEHRCARDTTRLQLVYYPKHDDAD